MKSRIRSASLFKYSYSHYLTTHSIGARIVCHFFNVVTYIPKAHIHSVFYFGPDANGIL